MKINYIAGPTASGKTRHLNEIAASAQAKGLEVLGPLPACTLQAVLKAREAPRYSNVSPLLRRKTVLLVDEADNLTSNQRHDLEATAHLGWHQVFIAYTGPLNQWENLA